MYIYIYIYILLAFTTSSVLAASEYNGFIQMFSGTDEALTTETFVFISLYTYLCITHGNSFVTAVRIIYIYIYH